MLGDVIDYGPDPVACLERVAEVADVWLVGNHEEYAVTPDDDHEDSAVLQWSLPLLAESAAWQTLRAKIAADGGPAHASRVEGYVHFVHASAGSPTQQYVWPGHEVQYIVFNTQIDERVFEFLDELRAPHGFNGHTHVPAIIVPREHHKVLDSYTGIDRHHVHTFVGPRVIFFVPKAPCSISGLADAKMFVNVGSCGQPRRLGDNRASYVLYDGDTVEFRRVEYPWAKTAAKLAKLPIPDDEKQALIERLETGV